MIKEVCCVDCYKTTEDLVNDAKPAAAAEHRSVPEQIEYWARIGKAVLENSDMPLRLIQDSMLSIKEAKAGQINPISLCWSHSQCRDLFSLSSPCMPFCHDLRSGFAWCILVVSHKSRSYFVVVGQALAVVPSTARRR